MSLHRRQIVLLSALVTLHSVVWATPCYWRDGSIATFGGNNYTPCSSSSVSTCCLLAEGDTCTPNGLCESSSGSLFRNACTDSTWTSPDCLPLCPDIIQYAQLTQCSDGSYCCAEDASCCDLGQGLFIDANKTLSSDTSTPTSSSSSPTATSTSTFGAPTKAWHFIIENAWLATPIIAAIGWIQTWVVSAMLVKGDYGFVADRRYAGLAKRTIMTSFLADEQTSNPSEVIACAAMDPGLSSQLDDLYDCKATALSYISWIIQLGATLYAVFIASFVWSQDGTLKYESAWIQFPLLLGVLNINRGTWAVAVLGCLLRKRMALLVTTTIAVILDIVFIFRAFDMAWHINGTDVPEWVGVIAWTLPSIETTILIAGIIAASYNVHYIGPKWFLFLPAGVWLAVGPWFIVVISILSHFAQQTLIGSS